MFHILQWLYTYVASVCSKCFIYFPSVHYKCVYMDVAYVSRIRCKCFIWMLHMFFNDISSVFRCFCKCFRRMFQVFQMHVSSVSSVFTRMLQMFHPDVLKINRMLLLGTHLPQQASERGSRGGASGLRVGSGATGDVRTARAPTWVWTSGRTVHLGASIADSKKVFFTAF
jgi:hypothetical protein